MTLNISSNPIQSTQKNSIHKIEDGNIIKELVGMFFQIFENPSGQNLVEATRQFFLEKGIDLGRNEATKVTQGIVDNLRVNSDSNDSDPPVLELPYKKGMRIVVDPGELVRVIIRSEEKEEKSETGRSEGIGFKKTANIENLAPQMREVFPALVSVWEKYRAPAPVITSGNDSKHTKNSKHYSNRAIDIRGNNVSDEKLKEMAAELQRVLGPDYYVQAEFFPNDPANDHIHVQYNG